MTQALINNLNCLQEKLVSNEAMFQGANKQIDSLDKTDFNKILDDKKQVNSFEKANFNQEINNKEQVATTSNKVGVGNQLSKEKSTIADLKSTKNINSTISSDVKAMSLSDLKDVVTVAMQDSKIEKSLDLTLAKNVTGIINQLKGVIESATEDGEIIVDEALLENLGAIINSADFQNIFNQVKEVSEDDEIQALFAQISSILNIKTSQETGLAVELQSIKSEIDSIFESSKQVEGVDFSVDVSLEKFVKSLEETVQEQFESALEEDLIKELNVESIESETSSFNGESLMQNQTPEEQGLKAMLNPEIETFDLKIDKSISVQNSQSVQVKSADATPSKILDQVARQLENLQTGSKVNIVLNPESLGRVVVQLIKTSEGLSAQFTVSSQEVRDMLMKGIDGLKETLTAQGIGVDNVAVKLNEVQKSEYNADWTEQEGSSGGNKEQERSNKEEKEKGLFEKMMAQTVQDENGNV